MCEKFTWRPVKTAPSSISNPSPRWGHSSCIIHEEIIFFGGYADSIYMNDIWSFNTKSMEWKMIETSGEKPKERSNSSLHYDTVNNQIILFGGGGANKIRYNEISVLNWASKEWKSIKLQEQKEVPWERTYHTCELLYPYLLVFGGEGIIDLNDLWVFNIQTLKWKEIVFDNGEPRPCGRRFHSSCIIDKEMFVIAGCYGKYRPLGDIYSIDLTSLLENGKTEGLNWKEWKFADQSLLTRWGHSSAVLEKCIYIFGGRFINDLNDTIVFDTSRKVLKGVKILSTTIPKPRRRSSLNLVGNCLIMFGGFNSDYYNDLYFLNVTRVQPMFKRIVDDHENILQLLRRNDPSELQISSCEGTKLTCHKGILFYYFKSFCKYESFIREIENKEKLKDLERLLVCLYHGYGESSLIDKYFLKVPKSIYEKWMEFTKVIDEFRVSKEAEINFAREAHINTIFTLKLEEFRHYIKTTKLVSYYNTTIKVNGKQVMCNKISLVKGSHYFHNVFSYKFNHNSLNAFSICLYLEDETLLDILLIYLQFGFVVVPEEFSYENWIGLYHLADYLVVDNFKNLVESQIHSLITDVTLQDIMEFAEGNNIEALGLACARIKISQEISQSKDLLAVNLDNCYMANYYSENRFEIKQAMIMKSQPLTIKSKSSTSELMENDKENNMENCQ